MNLKNKMKLHSKTYNFEKKHPEVIKTLGTLIEKLTADEGDAVVAKSAPTLIKYLK